MIRKPGRNVQEHKRLNKNSGTVFVTRPSILTTVFFFFFVSRKFHGSQHFWAFCGLFFLLGKSLKTIFPDRRKKTTKQNTGQAHGVSRVRRIATPHCTGYTRVIPGVIPGPWPAAEAPPCITRALFVQSTEPTLRHTRDQQPTANFLSWRALSRHKLFVATVRSRGTVAPPRRRSTYNLQRYDQAYALRARGRLCRFDRMNERCNLMKNDRTCRFFLSLFREISAKRQKMPG